LTRSRTPAASEPRGADAVSNNDRTIQSYEGYARKYAHAVSTRPSGVAEDALRRMVDIVQPGGTVLEVGSGPGWDADFVESLGVVVRRTDVTIAFREFQSERGKQVDALNVISDDLGGPYDAVMALYVLQHIDRHLLDPVLDNVWRALRPEGVLLVSIREGTGELWECSEVSGDYHVVLWSQDGFATRLANAGLRVDWSAQSVDEDGAWLTILARKVQCA